MSKAKKVVKVNLKSANMLPRFSDDELTGLAERVGLTLEQLQTLHELAHATYQYIGHDLEGPHKRADLIEAVMDADYIENTDRERGPRKKLTPELLSWLHTKASTFKLEHVYEAIGAAFPYPKYE